MRKEEKKINIISEEVISFLDKLNVLLLVLDLNGNIVKLNKRGCDIVGCRKNIIGEDWFQFLPEDVRTQTRDYFQEIINERCDLEKIHENEVLCKNNQRRLISWKNDVIKDKNGDVVGMIGTGRDITDERIRMKELGKKNKINKDILENSPFGIFVINKNGNVDYVNKAMLEISAADYKRFMSLNFFKHKMYKKLGLDKKIKAGLDGEYFRAESIKYTSSKGKKTTIRNFTGIPLDDQTDRKLLIIVENITELSKKQKEIEDKGKYLKNVIESVGYPLYSINVKDYTITMANSAALRGSKIRENLKCYKVTHGRTSPCSGEEHKCPLKVVVETKKPFVVEHIHFDDNNNPRNMEVHGYPIFNEKGEVIEIIESSLDITARKKAFEVVEKQEEMQRDILDNANDLIQSVDISGNLIYVNSAWKKKLGYTDEEVKKINIFKDVIHPDFLNSCQKELAQVVKQKMINNAQVAYKTKKNKILYLEGNISCKYENGKPISTRGIFRDVTEKMMYEKEMLKRTNEIERFNKLAVDRELKMIELKKTIKMLEENLNKKNNS